MDKKTQRKLAAMWFESTGASMLDSGGHYGRAWQQARKVIKARFADVVTKQPADGMTDGMAADIERLLGLSDFDSDHNYREALDIMKALGGHDAVEDVLIDILDAMPQVNLKFDTYTARSYVYTHSLVKDDGVWAILFNAYRNYTRDLTRDNVRAFAQGFGKWLVDFGMAKRATSDLAVCVNIPSDARDAKKNTFKTLLITVDWVGRKYVHIPKSFVPYKMRVDDGLDTVRFGIPSRNGVIAIFEIEPPHQTVPTIEFTKSAWHWLNSLQDCTDSDLEYSEGWMSLYEAWYHETGESAWGSGIEELFDWLKKKGLIESVEVSSDNTYNWETAIDETFQLTVGRDIEWYIEPDDCYDGMLNFITTSPDGETQEWHIDPPSENVMWLSKHGGCDVRGGYTDSVPFSIGYDGGLYTAADGTIAPAVDGSSDIHTRFKVNDPDLLIPYTPEEVEGMLVRFAAWFGVRAFTENKTSQAAWEKFQRVHKDAYDFKTFCESRQIDDPYTPEYKAYEAWWDLAMNVRSTTPKPPQYKHMHDPNVWAVYYQYADTFPCNFTEFCEVNGLPKMQISEWVRESFERYQANGELPFNGWRTDDAYHWYEDSSTGGRQLESFIPTGDPDLRGDGEHLYIDNDGNGYCPITGYKLVGFIY